VRKTGVSRVSRVELRGERRAVREKESVGPPEPALAIEVPEEPRKEVSALRGKVENGRDRVLALVERVEVHLDQEGTDVIGVEIPACGTQHLRIGTLAVGLEQVDESGFTGVEPVVEPGDLDSLSIREGGPLGGLVGQGGSRLEPRSLS
jgi:hypothetical protein